MPHLDQDGKSKTASAVDEKHYPAMGQSDHKSPPAPAASISSQEIAERAHQIWIHKGRPANSAEEDWIEAERELHDAQLSRRLTQMTHEKGGSVQS
ncbi:MAG: DUF2934 domain-containing protein [Bryobacteraceae bacterium]|jgi:hypothetical protein